MNRKKVFRRVRIGAITLVALLVVTLGTVKLLFGLGSSYADVGGAPLVAKADVTAVTNLEFPPGNVTGSRDGRIFFNTHPLVESQRFTDKFLFELVDGKPRPYPDQKSQADLKYVFGLTVDTKNRLWLTAPANLDHERTRLIAYDLNTNKKVVDHELDPGVAQFGQDLRVTPDGKSIILANPGAFRFTSSSLVVLDLETWQAREVLGDSPAIQPENWVIHTSDGPYRVGYGLLTFQVGLDGIAISPDGKWVFLAAMSHGTLYKVPLADVLDPQLSSSALDARVTRVGPKPLSDGIDAGPDGSVLITDVEHGGITRLDQQGDPRSLVRLKQVAWADGVFYAPDGDVYFTDSAIPKYIDPLLRSPDLDELSAGRPYHLYRFQLPA